MSAAIRMLLHKLWSALILATALIIAHPATADVSERLRLSEVSASERLRLRVHAQALSSGMLPPYGLVRMRNDMARQGYYFESGRPVLVARDWAASPSLNWDGNINGGILQDRFVFNGLVFEAAPEVRAKFGLVAGTQGSGIVRYAWQTGKLVEVSGMIDVGWSPAHGIGRANTALSVCSKNHLTGWTFLDLCSTAAKSWRELATSTARQASAEVLHIVATNVAAHQFGIRYDRTLGSERAQDRVALSTESVWHRLATRMELTLGRPIENDTVLQYRLESGTTWLMLNRPFTLDLSTEVLKGGAFLAVPRRDRINGLSLSTRLRPGMTLRFGAVDSSSTAGIANYTQVTIDLRLDRLR